MTMSRMPRCVFVRLVVGNSSTPSGGCIDHPECATTEIHSAANGSRPRGSIRVLQVVAVRSPAEGRSAMVCAWQDRQMPIG